jgi:hypothetical protein
MKKILFVIMIIGLLVGCSKPPMKQDLNRENETLEIHFFTFSNELEMIEDLRNKGYEVPNELLGFSVWSPQDNKCEVYHVTPKYTDDIRTKTLGHEVAHCIYGSFH